MTARVKWEVSFGTTFSSRNVMVCCTMYLLSVHMGHAPLDFCFLEDHATFASCPLYP